jgi:hypothetical protein
MPTYEVRLTKPVLFSVTLAVSDEEVARGTAAEFVLHWAKSLSADDFEAKRIPSTPDDNGDARSEARYEQTTVDDESERIERERWSSAESEDE